MNHVNDDILLKYAFDLLDRPQPEEIAAHLAECGGCRDKLAQLQQQFAVLDTLGEDVPISEALIQKTLAIKAERRQSPDESPINASVIGRLTSPRFYKAWIPLAAAAAVVLIGSVLVLNQSGTDIKDATPAAEKPVATLDTPDERVASLPSKARSDGGTMTVLPAAIPAQPKDVVRVVPTDAIGDTPPFAPASAIELVVLPKPDKTQVTIYNSADLTLVRDTRKLTLKPGWNWLQFMWDGTLIDPTSLSLTPLEHGNKIDIQQLVYPARLKDIGRWLIRSEVEGAVPFEITYFASGLSWRAFYMGTMNENETAMTLKGYVNVANNSGQDFENAQTRLVIGEVHLLDRIPDLARRRYPYGPEIMDEEGSVTRYNWYGRDDKVPILGDIPTIGRLFSNEPSTGFGVERYFAIKDIEKEGLSEYFLYTIEGAEDLPNTWAKRLPSFDVDDIPVKSLYKYDEDRYGRDTVRFVSFVNDTEHELGTTPIPEGSVKIYRNVNAQQNLSYVGGTDVKYIPVNEDIELNLGPARLVKIEPILMDYKTDNYIADELGNIYTGYLIKDGQRLYNMIGFDEIETWQIKLTNTREIPVDVEITRNFGTDYWELQVDGGPEAHPTYKKHDKSHGRFTLTLPPRSEETFTYTVTKYHGQRSEVYTKQLQERQQ